LSEAGVRDQHIDRPECSLGRIDEFGRNCGRAQISVDGDSPAAVGDDLARELLGRLGVRSVAEGDGRSSPASRRASAPPIPPLAPVTSATRPASLVSVSIDSPFAYHWFRDALTTVVSPIRSRALRTNSLGLPWPSSQEAEVRRAAYLKSRSGGFCP
jgi:hypothetical protein